MLPLAEVMRNFKGSSSKWLNEERRGTRFAWQAGYTAFSVSRSNMDTVEGYIARQKSTTARERSRKSCSTFSERTVLTLMSAICGTDLRPYGARTFCGAGFPRLKPWAMPLGRSAALPRAGEQRRGAHGT